MRIKALVVLFMMPLVARAQSLLRDTQQAGDNPDATAEQAQLLQQAPLKEASLFYVSAPKPKSYKKNDLVTIIIDEQTKQLTDADNKSEKDLTFNASVNALPNLLKLLETRLQPSDRNPLSTVGVTASTPWEGKGTYNRTDQLTAKITATIIDVKPNGVLVLEARKTVTKDSDVTTIVLTGNARTEDVTTSNTVLSSQLADMIVSMVNKGDTKDSTTKGWIPRLLDTLFAF